MKRGDEFASSGQFAKAVERYEAAIRIDPKDGPTRLKLARAYKQAGRHGDWSREALLAADLLPADPEAQLEGLESLLAVRRFVDVVDRATILLERTPNDPALLVLLGTAEARLGDTARAIWMFDEAIRSGRSAASAWVGLRPETSRAQDARAETALRRALAVAPGNPRVHLALASFLWAAGRLDEGADVLKTQADRHPDDAYLNRLLGLHYVTRSRPADAERHLKLAAATGDPDSRLALADFYTRARRYADAFQILEPMAGASDKDGTIALKCADVEVRQNRLEPARKRVEAVLARDAHNPRALRIKAQILYAEGNFSGAVAVARDAVASDLGSHEARVVLARSLVHTGDQDGAFTEYTAAWRADTRDPQIARELATVALTLGRNDVALAMASRSAQLDPNDADTAILLARAQIRAGQFDAAERTIAPLLSKSSPSVELMVLNADILAGRGRQDDARALYLRVLQQNPDAIGALSGLVSVEIVAGQAARVRPRIDQATARHPRDPAYLLLSARVAWAAADATRAETTLKAILGSDPAHVDAATFLAEVLARQGRRDEARQIIERALASRGSSQVLQASLAGLLEDMGQMAEARKRYESILAANPAAYAIAARLAALYANQGDNLDVALNYAQEAKQNLRNDPFVDDTLGWVYLRKNLPALALPHLESAVATDPDRATFRYHLGVAYERMGEVLKAREQLTRALAIDPNFPAAADARTLLKSLPR